MLLAKDAIGVIKPNLNEPTESTDLFAATLTGSKNTTVFNNIKSV